MAGTGAVGRVSLMRTDRSVSASNTQSVSLRVANEKGRRCGRSDSGGHLTDTTCMKLIIYEPYLLINY